MLIKNNFEVAQPVDKVWKFFDDIPQVAACLPGTRLTEDLGDGKYNGVVAISMGPVRLQFAGTAQIKERDDAVVLAVAQVLGQPGSGQAGGDLGDVVKELPHLVDGLRHLEVVLDQHQAS